MNDILHRNSKMETMESSMDNSSDVRLQALKSLHMILQEKDQTAQVYREKSQRYEKALQQAENRYGNQNINDNSRFRYVILCALGLLSLYGCVFFSHFWSIAHTFASFIFSVWPTDCHLSFAFYSCVSSSFKQMLVSRFWSKLHNFDPTVKRHSKTLICGPI